MPRVTALLRQAHKSLQDVELLKVIRSEIQHEVSSPPPSKIYERGSLGGFEVMWDSPASQDVVLRKKCESGEEIVVSAVVNTGRFGEETRTQEAVMKVCVKKFGLSSILQFDCGLGEYQNPSGNVSPNFSIHSCHYLPSMTQPAQSAYKGPSFWTLDESLRSALHQYLEAKGIHENLIGFLLHHLHDKEQHQYTNWLQKLESIVRRDK